MLRPRALLWLAAPMVAAAVAAAGPAPRAHVQLTVWQTAQPVTGGGRAPSAAFGGLTYGGAAPTGALVADQRDVEVPADGELRIAGVAATLDPGSVQLTAPGLAVREQRFAQGGGTPTDIVARHVGEPVTVVTAKGELTGVLRAVDDRTLVLETAGHTEVLRRDYLQDIKLTAGGAGAALAWRVTSSKPGVQPVGLVYRASGMTWLPDYIGILDDAAGTVELAARATIHNGTGATFDDAEVTLVSTTGAGPTLHASRFTLPEHVHIGAGDLVTVDMAPDKAVKARQVVVYQPVNEDVTRAGMLPDVQQECSQVSQADPSQRGELSVEVELPTGVALPEGRARLFRRSKAGAPLELVRDDLLHASAGVARMHVATLETITGERKQVSCIADPTRRRLEEKLEILIENKAAHVQDVVVRELLWRAPLWRIDPASESTKGTRAGDGAQEYRVHVAANGSAKVTYTVVYTW